MRRLAWVQGWGLRRVPALERWSAQGFRQKHYEFPQPQLRARLWGLQLAQPLEQLWVLQSAPQ